MLNQAVNAPENLKNLPGYDQNPKFSPDGHYLAWTSMARDGYEADRMRLCCYDLKTGEKTFLTESFDSNVDDYCWAPDARTIYYIGVWHATENLYSTNLQGEVKQITNFQADFGSLQMLNEPAEDTLTATQVAKTFNMTTLDFNAVLRDMGIQYRRGGRWNLSDDLQGRGYTTERTYVSYTLKGEKKIKTYMTWTMAGLHYLNAKLGYPNY
jgi:dipeptidyl aminopeptidase/acylaminoacyl peptidase